jgi:hypothetical protein
MVLAHRISTVDSPKHRGGGHCDQAVMHSKGTRSLYKQLLHTVRGVWPGIPFGIASSGTGSFCLKRCLPLKSNDANPFGTGHQRPPSACPSRRGSGDRYKSRHPAAFAIVELRNAVEVDLHWLFCYSRASAWSPSKDYQRVDDGS